MWIARASWVLCLLALMFWCGPARGQSYSNCTNNTYSGADCPDEGMAYSAVIAAAEYYRSIQSQPSAYVVGAVTRSTASGWVSLSAPVKFVSTGSVISNRSRRFPVAATCSTRPPQSGWLVDNLGAKCYQGCSYAYTPTSATFDATGNTCTASSETPEPKPDTDGDGVPDDTDAFPNDPNESQDTDGDGIGDNADIAPDDPTNGEDDGDGDEKDNQAGGGGDCGAPPSCSGDAIACNTNWQIWKLRCSTATVTGSPEVCSGAYTCTGDSAQCAQVALLRKTACSAALQGNLDSDGDGFGVGDSANLKAIKDAVTAPAQSMENPSIAWMDGVGDVESW